MNGLSGTLYLALVVLLATANALAPSFTRVSSSKTKLYLTPQQGSQLVAAWNALSSHQDDDENYHYKEIHRDEETKFKALKAVRDFMSRVFSLPSNMIRRDKAVGHADVLYYPIVGFHFVRGHSRAFPTTACTAVCHLPSSHPVYGWFTPACELDLYSDNYCQDPSSSLS